MTTSNITITWQMSFWNYSLPSSMSIFSFFSSSSGTPRMYKTLLHLIRTSPRVPADCPSIHSSVLASWRFMYASTDTRKPLYSIPHFSFATTGFPVRSLRNGFGFTGTVYRVTIEFWLIGCNSSTWRENAKFHVRLISSNFLWVNSYMLSDSRSNHTILVLKLFPWKPIFHWNCFDAAQWENWFPSEEHYTYGVSAISKIITSN